MGDNEPHTNGVNGGGESDDEVNISGALWCLVVLCGTLWCFVVMIMKMILSMMANIGSTGAGRVMTRWIFDNFHFEDDGELKRAMFGDKGSDDGMTVSN